MNRMSILLSVLILSSLVVGCSSQTAPAATAVPPAAPTQAKPTAPTQAKPAAPTQASAAAATQAPATAATQAPAAPPAAAGDAQVINITLTIYDMQPPEVTVKAGSKVHFVFKNTDTEEHDVVSAAGKLKSILVPGGKTVEADWSVPETPGTFEAICTIHREIKPLRIIVVK